MNNRLFRIVTAALLVSGAMLLVSLQFSLGNAVWYLTGYAAGSIMISSVRLFVTRRGFRIGLSMIEIIAHLTVGTLIIFSLNITPASAYLAWFRLVDDGEAAGVLATLFALKATFFATLAATAVLRRSAVASILSGVGLVALVFYAVLQQPAIMYLAVGSGMIAALGVGLRIPRRRALVRVGPLLLIMMIAAGGSLIFGLSRPGRFSPLVDLVPTTFVTSTVVSLVPDFPFLYHMPGYGHNLGERDIGSRPSLTERPVFAVTGTAGETVYLRTAAFDYFTGNGWARRIDRSDDLSGRIPFSSESPDQYERPLRVEVLIDFFSSAPHTLDTEAINLYRGDFPPVTSQTLDAGVLFEVPVVRGTVFYLDRSPPAGMTTIQDGPVQQPTNLSRYLKLPEEIPESVSALADAVGTGDALSTAENIEAYLASNYYYSLNPANPSRNTGNPVWEFLTGDGTGYCVHFATAFALLARMNDIPARYVTGFLVNFPADADTVEVPGFSSHAWVEIWIPDSGWVTREATPPMLPEFFDDPAYYELYNPFSNSFTARQLELIMGDRVPAQSTVAAPRTRVSIDVGRFVPSFVGVVAAAATLWFFLASSRAPTGRRRRLILALRRLVRKGLRIGSEDPASVGWNRWAESVLQSSGIDVSEASGVAHEAFFGGREIDTESIRRVRDLTRRLSGRESRRSA